MSEWQVLDLPGDPAPGDPVRCRELATKLLHEAELAEHNTTRLRSVASTGGDLHMEGDYAPKFQQVLGELPDELAKLGKAYRRCGEAVSGFATGLEQAKTQAGAALRQGQDAEGRYQGALREIRAVLPPGQDPTLAGRLNDSLLESAITTLDEGTKTQARAAARRARSAEEDRQRARRLATDAARLRGDAETKCVDGIHDALNDSGIKNKSWWEKAWDTVSAPFRSWDAFIDLCSKVAMVAGIAAMFISGPIGWALMAAALVAGAAIMADTVVKFAQGKAGLGDLAFAALGCIPGGRGVASLAKLGKGALGLAKGLRAGGGTAILTGLRTAATKTGTAIRTGITSFRQCAVSMANRLSKLIKDPVDVSTGEMVLQQTEVELPGVLPLLLTRTHLSSYRVGRWFGPTWASTLDQRLEIGPAGVCYAAEDGMLLVFPVPTPNGEPVWPEEGPRRPLSVTDQGHYTLTDPDTGHTLHFAPHPTDGWVLPLSGVSDRHGNRVTLDYDPDGTLTQIRHSGGYRIAVDTHDELITALRLRGSDNGSDNGTDVTLIRYRYNAARRLTEVINSSDLPLRFDYDTEGRITRWTDRNDTWYTYTYDDQGRCVRSCGSGGFLEETFTYHPAGPGGAITELTDSFGQVTRFELNDAHQIIRGTNPLGHAIVSEWDRYDRLLSRTDPLGCTTRYTYDDAGNLITVTRPDGTQALADYNTLRQPVTITDAGGASWHQQYDERGNLTAVIDPTGATTTYSYNAYGHLTTITDALGHTRNITTNPAGLPVAVTDPQGATTHYDRDTFGRIKTVTDPLGGIACLGWTIEGKLAWRTQPDGATERWAWDGEGNLIEHRDPLGQTTRFTYTHFDLPVTQIGPDGTRLEFSYDTELRLTTVTNPQCLTWRYDYDPAGNLLRETDYNNRTLSYRYDAAGQLLERTNGAGQTTNYTRDLLGNITQQRSGDTATSFAYDPAGRLIHATNPDTDLTFTRDPLGRILTETCNGRTLTNTYDTLGRRTHRRTPTGADSTWEYDPNHRPITLHTAGHTLRFTHDPAGRETERQLDTGVTLTQTWNPNHRLASQTLTAGTTGPEQPTSVRGARLLQHRSYTYRPDGYLTRIDDHLTGTRHFDLDPTGRVTAVNGPGWTERYAYDPTGNITHATWPQTPALDAAAQGEREYTGTLIRHAGNTRYRHDAQGRVTLRQQKRLSAKPRTWHYSWDTDDRLIAVTTPDDQHWRYRYDPLGRRIAKQRLTTDNITVLEQINFTWDGTVLAEQTYTRPDDPGRTTVWEWEPDAFRPVSQTERTSPGSASQEWIDQQFYAIVTDLVGTPTELLGPDGILAQHPNATLWGTVVDRNGSDARCPLRFPGQYFDPETGLNYNYHRYYDPVTARYQSGDPLGLTPQPNPHTYVRNPTYWIDPFGLAPGYGGAARSVRYGPMNPGPLAADVANTFRGGSYTAVTSNQSTTLYRVYSGNRELGSYWTRTKPSGPVQSIIDSALDPAWGNQATRWAQVEVPAGTTFFEGAAAAQRGLVGGGNQVFIQRVDASWVVARGSF